MKCSMLLFGLLVLAAKDISATDSNGTVSASTQGQASTEATPLKDSVSDIITLPLTAFKVQHSLKSPNAENVEADLVGLPLAKAENTTETTPAPPFSNLWFNAGQSLGSAANSLSSWLNNRLVPLVPQTTSTTTKPPEVIVRLQSNKPARKPLITIDAKRKPEEDHIKPAVEDSTEYGDDDDEDDEPEYEENEEVTTKKKTKPNRKSNKKRKETDNEEDNKESEEEDDNENENENDGEEEEENEENDEEVQEEEEGEEEEEEEAPPKKKRKHSKKKQNRPKVDNNRRGNVADYEGEDEDEYVDEYYEDDGYYDNGPIKTSGRQQQQGLLNRFRQLAQIPHATQQTSPGNKPGYRPVRIVQNGQMVQLVQDNPNNKRRRRPSDNQSYQLVPIINNQEQKQKRKQVNRPDPATQFIIPFPQSSSNQNGQKTPPQYISIPWSQLGLTGPQQEAAQNSQHAKPIIVNLSQYAMPQNQKRRRRPIYASTHVVSNGKRKKLRRPIQKNHIIPVLTDETIREIFKVPEIPPSRTPPESEISPHKEEPPMNNSDMHMEELPTPKPTPSPQLEVNATEIENDKNEASFIVVGDDDDDEPTPRHVMPKRYLHMGGMKPYMEVWNKGRFYFKRGRQMRKTKPLKELESKIMSISPPKEVPITTDNSSEVTFNTPPTIVAMEAEQTSSTVSPPPE